MALVAAAFISAQGRSEYLFKKDGSIIHGKITRENAKSVTIKAASGPAAQVERSDIMRILYTELYMGKVYIRLTTGKVLDGYMVDEDQTTYTFRKELYQPEEFTLPRSKVMFLVRSNPTDLEAKADRRYIALKWSAPFVQPKSYNIYARAASEKEFKVVGTSRSTNYRITGLRSNTPFKLYVTAVDREDKETLPSDEISVTTLNAPPTAPEGIMLKSRMDKESGKLSAEISWRAATDIDGTVAGYRIYRESESGFGRLTDTKATIHMLNGLDPKANLRFLVRAVDDRGDESEDSGVVSTRTRGIDVSANASFFAPMGKFSDLADPGFGALVRAGMNDVYIENLTTYVETGIYRTAGSSDRVDYFAMVPVMVGAAYDIPMFSFMSVSPAFSFGYAYTAISYQETLLASAKAKTAFEPVLSAGLDLTFTMGQHFFMRAGGRFGAILESDGPMYFSTVTLGAGYLFGM
jgi:hypothetical protein